MPYKRRSSRIGPEDDVSFNSPSGSTLEVNQIPKRGGSISEATSSDRIKYIPPWSEPYVIGVAGYSGSGKTSVSQKIIHELNQPWTVLLSFDNYYKPLTSEESARAFKNEYDFDTPQSLDLDILVEHLNALKRGEKVDIPIYSFAAHNRTEKVETIYGANVIIIEGIYALYDERLLEMMDLKVFVDTDLDVCLARRLTRDILYRGRDLAGCLKQWELFVKPNLVRYVKPTMMNADLVIPRGSLNEIGINLMIQHVEKQLALKSTIHLQRLHQLGKQYGLDMSRVTILPNTNYIKGLHSQLLSQETERSDFIFHFDKMGILLLEMGLNKLGPLNYAEEEVTTPQGYKAKGVSFEQELIAVSIIRSGDCFMNAIKKTLNDVPIGKLLIQSDTSTGEPQLHCDTLPSFDNSKNQQIFLFDSQVISGAQLIMAIQVLLDHNFPQENITIITYLSTEIGLKRITNVFPNLNQVVIGKVSNGECVHNEEGFTDTVWHFRNRFIDSLYFGTD